MSNLYKLITLYIRFYQYVNIFYSLKALRAKIQEVMSELLQ